MAGVACHLAEIPPDGRERSDGPLEFGDLCYRDRHVGGRMRMDQCREVCRGSHLARPRPLENAGRVAWRNANRNSLGERPWRVAVGRQGWRRRHVLLECVRNELREEP